MIVSETLTAFARRFVPIYEDESGAVTVDWVVLTAAITVFGLLAWSIIDGGVQQGASDIRAGILSAADL